MSPSRSRTRRTTGTRCSGGPRPPGTTRTNRTGLGADDPMTARRQEASPVHPMDPIPIPKTTARSRDGVAQDSSPAQVIRSIRIFPSSCSASWETRLAGRWDRPLPPYSRKPMRTWTFCWSCCCWWWWWWCCCCCFSVFSCRPVWVVRPRGLAKPASARRVSSGGSFALAFASNRIHRTKRYYRFLKMRIVALKTIASRMEDTAVKSCVVAQLFVN